LLASWKLLTKKAGSGSVNQVYESKNLDSNSWYQNVKDPEHSIPCLEEMNIPTGGLEALALEIMRFKQKYLENFTFFLLTANLLMLPEFSIILKQDLINLNFETACLFRRLYKKYVNCKVQTNMYSYMASHCVRTNKRMGNT
jgi:hypothetical protein